MEKKTLSSIQTLRGIACILVVLCHTSLISSGHYGVDIFFVISGFVIMYSTEKALIFFWQKRLKRIIPLYWFMTIITAICVYMAPHLFNLYEVSTTYLLKSLLFIPYEHSGIQQPVLGLAWTLNYEILFYVIFWIAIKINVKRRGIISIIFCCFLCIIGLIFNDLPMPLSYWTNSIILEFCFGIIAYEVYTKLIVKSSNKNNISSENKYTCIILIGVGCVGGIIMDRILKLKLPRYFAGMVAAIILLIFLYEEMNISWNCFIVYVGNISYTIYLLHIYPLRLVERVGKRFTDNEIIIASMAVFFSIICSIIFHKITVYLHKRVINAKVVWHRKYF